MNSLNYLTNLIMYQISKAILVIVIEKHEKGTDNPPMTIYVNKIENRISFEIKTKIYLELLTPETIKLFESTKSKETKNENGQNVADLEITKVVLVYCNIFNNNYQQD